MFMRVSIKRLLDFKRRNGHHWHRHKLRYTYSTLTLQTYPRHRRVIIIIATMFHIYPYPETHRFKRPTDLWTRERKLSTFDFHYDFHSPQSQADPSRSQSEVDPPLPNTVVNNRRDSGSIGVTRAHTALNLFPSILSCPFSGGACARLLPREINWISLIAFNNTRCDSIFHLQPYSSSSILPRNFS